MEHFAVVHIISFILVVGTFDYAYSCRGGYEAHGSYCYRIHTYGKTWNDARLSCQNDGAYIVEVHTSHKNTEVRNMVTSHHMNQTWLGATDKRTEGYWTWYITKQGFTFSAWKSGHPSHTIPDNDCLEFSPTKSSAEWSDVNCDLKLPYICEMSSSSPANIG